MKPFEGCPLFLHKGSGQWAKKIRGRTVYFGKDLAKALLRWNEEKDDLLAGKPRKSKGEPKPTLKELGNLFYHRHKVEAEDGRRGARHVELCRLSIKRMVDLFGADRDPDTLSPIDFDRLKKSLFNPAPGDSGKGRKVNRRSASTVAGDVRRIRRFLGWCHNRELIAAPRFGEGFSATTRVARTKESLRKRKDLTSEQILSVIAKCSDRFLPIVLIAINAGIGNKDIAEISISDIKPDGWIDLPRLKTGADRRFPLWPETVTAIENYLPIRPNPKTSDYADHLFLTRYGLPWVRDTKIRIDSIGHAFSDIRDDAGIPDHSFYDLRRTFQTVASETLDFPAVKFVMGHAKGARDMSALYTQHISDDRIQAVCEHVRQWLYG